MPEATLKDRRDLLEYCNRLYQRDLVGSTQGNMSIRLGAGNILITPTGGNLGYLKPSDLAIINSNGKPVGGKRKPSSEYYLHVGIYAARKDVKAICHAHPVATTAIAISDIDINRPILPEIICVFGAIPMIEYGTPGTSELFEKLEPFIAEYDALVLRNHGAVTLGENLEQAFNRMEMLERYARTLLMAKQHGAIKEIPDDLIGQIPDAEKLARILYNYIKTSGFIRVGKIKYF